MRRGLSLASLLPVLALYLPVAVVNARAQSSSTPHAGIILYREGKHSEAKPQLLSAARADPSNATVAFYLGRIHLGEGAIDQAIKSFENAVRIEPRNSRYHQALGEAYGVKVRQVGRLKQARLAGKVRGELETAVALDPDNVEARAGLMQFFLVAPGFVGGSVDKARAQATEIRSRNPLAGGLAFGAIYEREKNLKRAGEEYEAAVAAYADSARAYYQLAAYYRRTQQWNQAFALLDSLRTRRPNEFEVHYHIGSTGAQSGQKLDAAEDALRRYLSRPWQGPPSPTPASAHLRLGNVYEKQGKADLARKEYEAVLRLDPRNEAARDALAGRGGRSRS